MRSSTCKWRWARIRSSALTADGVAGGSHSHSQSGVGSKEQNHESENEDEDGDCNRVVLRIWERSDLETFSVNLMQHFLLHGTLTHARPEAEGTRHFGDLCLVWSLRFARDPTTQQKVTPRCRVVGGSRDLTPLSPMLPPS